MKITILILIMALSLGAIAQNCDIAQTGVGLYNEYNTAPVGSIAAGERANFRFSIANFGSAPGCSIPANSVRAVFDFPNLLPKPYHYDGPSSFVSGYFTWTYNATDELLTGINNSEIPNGLGDAEILIPVKGFVTGTASSTLRLTQLNAVPDNGGNNLASAQLVVAGQGPVPVRLLSFTAKADKCNAILKWATASESNFSHFEIEYSPDARTFIMIGTVAGKNLGTGSSYDFSYQQLSGNGYYRLKQVDKDGHFEYSYTVNTRTNCKEQEKILVYPNPVHYDQKLEVHVSGYPDTGLSGEIFNTAGQRLGSYALVNGTNEISVAKLPGGAYMLYVVSAGKRVETFKVIVKR